MSSNSRKAAAFCALSITLATGSTALAQEADDDPIRDLVSRRTLESYKSTLKGLNAAQTTLSAVAKLTGATID
jgi:hypothetical protein